MTDGHENVVDEKSFISIFSLISRLFNSKIKKKTRKLTMNIWFVKNRLKLNCPSATKFDFTTLILLSDEKYAFKGYLC